jgi:hypothetical protein
MNVVASTHQAFEVSARATVARAVFHWARIRARGVSRLTVRQSARVVVAG